MNIETEQTKSHRSEPVDDRVSNGGPVDRVAHIWTWGRGAQTADLWTKWHRYDLNGGRTQTTWTEVWEGDLVKAQIKIALPSTVEHKY